MGKLVVVGVAGAVALWYGVPAVLQGRIGGRLGDDLARAFGDLAALRRMRSKLRQEGKAARSYKEAPRAEYTA